jgi:PAS domain S-box-containing protein
MALGECCAVLNSGRFPRLELALAVLLLVLVSAFAWARAGDSADTSSLDSPVDTETIRLPVVEGKGIRFARIPSSQGLYQVRVSDIVQDDQGFIWFGTLNGLIRYDGYNFKVFKHDLERQESLSGVYIDSLFKDRAGTIWVGTDQFLDRFDPLTETFSHYHFDVPDSSGLPTTVNQISQDSSGMLWLSTRKGLFRLDPVTGKTKHFYHDPGDPSSLGDNAIKSTGEDREGRFWVGTSQTLDEFDRNTGKVKRHVLTGESGVGLSFHEDRFGVFWIVYGPEGSIATFDPKTNKLTRYGFDSRGPESNSKNPAYALLEDHEGTMWFGTAVRGLLKFDREHRRFISYHNLPGDSDSLLDNRVIALFEDREKNIWVGMHDVGPHFFATRPPPFTKFTNSSGSRNRISPGLVGALYEDRQGVLWVGVNRSLVRIDRKTGLSSSFQPVAGSEVLSIIEDGPDVLWIAGTNPLLRYNRKTGELRRYIHDRSDPSTLCSGVVERLLIDHRDVLWAATWDGLCRFDPLTQRFTTYKPDPKTRGLNYYAIAEDPQGNLWLGGNLGLHRFDPNTDQFTVYSHKSDDPHSLSDNRVLAIYFDRAGSMWVGTQNGLDKFVPRTSTFVVYDERDGMGGNVVSCILEDQRGLLWMSTNKGVSSFDPRTQKFSNYTVADGLPGPDFSGYGACFKSAAGEIFFGGFSGVTAFFPDQVVADAVVANAFVPPIVLTDFRLFGSPVTLSPGSPLKKAVNYTDTIALSHSQNIFSIGFSALSFFNPATNRYRYMLEGLDQKWNEEGSDQRLASYTTLPAGTYMFRVQGASRRGAWSEPGAQLRIQILPPWWNTWWFRALWATACLALLWGLYRVRIKQLRRQEKKLRDVIETMPTFASTALPDGSMDFVNRHWQDYTGLSTEKTVGSGWEAAVHPEDLKRHAEKWRASVASGAPFENEVRYRRAADGQYRWFLARAVPLRDQRGTILKWYGISTDIEDRKRAEEGLQRSQFYIGEGQRVAHMGSWAFDATGFSYWSPELFQVHGLDPSGKPPTVEEYLALAHPEDRAFMKQGIAKMLDDHLAFDFTKRIVRPDGEIRHLRCVGVPVTQEGTFQGFLGTVMDVTEQERLTEELRLSERYLSEAQSLAHTGSCAIDGTSRETVYWSDEMFRLFGFDPQQGLPMFDQWLQRIHPEDCDKVKLASERTFFTKVNCDVEFRIVKPDGTVKHIHGIGHPVLSATGELVQVLGTMVDVTERKHADETRDRLRQLEADLAHTNRVSTLGEMAASLAHEIKQPIAAAITSANSCVEWLAHEPPNLDRAREAAGRIDKYGNRAGEIIDRIRSFYKKSPPQRELVDVNGIIEEILTLLKSEADRCSVAMRTELVAELPKIMADRVQLQQVFMNLMLNAIEAMTYSSGELTVKSQLQDGQLQFSVRDTGVGLPKEKVDEIFSAFFTTKPQGSGMGLSISRSIVESHGGRLWATANDGPGATFHFTLPTAAEILLVPATGT